MGNAAHGTSSSIGMGMNTVIGPKAEGILKESE
jgi:hypothetical protein